MPLTTFVLIHSPLVGPLTWSLVADGLRQRGYEVVVPKVTHQVGSPDPFWKQHAEAVQQAMTQLSPDQSVTLVAHSGAGPLLPAIRSLIPNPVDAYLFVDAGIPRDGASRLDLMKSESLAWGEQFEQELLGGRQFPTWSVEDLREVLPDLNLRQQLVAELQPRSLDFFSEPIPVSETWPDAPCAYIQLSKTYSSYAETARARGWQVIHSPAGHFHMLVDPVAVTDAILM